jgi:signal-transduction protein with cAMP-binding, CBS, and nucleotidyltransferase domain
MEKITNILEKKQPHFHTVSPASTCGNALSQMCCENVDYLVVLDDENGYLGLVTEHDIASGVLSAKREIDKIKVNEILNTRLPAATTDDTVEKCMQLMQQHHVRYLPVFENFLFKGVVSSEDILDEAVRNRTEIFDTELARRGRFGVLT